MENCATPGKRLIYIFLDAMHVEEMKKLSQTRKCLYDLDKMVVVFI